MLLWTAVCRQKPGCPTQRRRQHGQQGAWTVVYVDIAAIDRHTGGTLPTQEQGSWSFVPYYFRVRRSLAACFRPNNERQEAEESDSVIFVCSRADGSRNFLVVCYDGLIVSEGRSSGRLWRPRQLLPSRELEKMGHSVISLRMHCFFLHITAFKK